MLKRLHCYFSVMFPILPRLFLGLIVFNEIYFLVLLNYGITSFHIGLQELIGAYTIFAFYMWLRIADDFKDYELDKRLFKERPLPSGKVKKSDLIFVCSIVLLVSVILNAMYMNNFIFFVVLHIYGYLMSKWFFKKNKIQSSLPLALITHNPVQIFVNIYVISFTCIKYQLHPFSLTICLVAFTLYFPSLIWELSRKIRAPQEETEYVTYSKLFGYKKMIILVLILTIVDIVTNIILVWNLNKIMVGLFVLLVSWMTYKFVEYYRNPNRYRIVMKVETYTYIQETMMLLTVVIFLLRGKI